MSENYEKYLTLARTARQEGNSEDAKVFYNKLREEDPQNGEAKYFYNYYALYEGTNGELPKRFSNLCVAVMSAVKLIKESSLSYDEQLNSISEIIDSFVPETWSENRYMNHKNHETKVGDKYVTVFDFHTITSTAKNGMKTIRDLGDTLYNLYGDSEKGKLLATFAWKEYVALSQKWYSWAVKGDAEIYAEKIKQIIPGYEMPKKAGCISLADKK